MTASRSPSYVTIRTVAAALALAVLTVQTMTASARPLSKCRLGNQSDYYSIVDGTLTDETRGELRKRVMIDALDDAEIVFRGRLLRRWYLSDVLETDIPAILEVYGEVSLLKGEMAETRRDGKAFVIRERICDGRCWLGALPEVTAPRDEPHRVVLAMSNTLDNPREAKDRRSNAVVYSGRIDALLGPCDPRQIDAAAAALLITSPDEMDRLRRSYPVRSAEDKRRDDAFIIKRIIGR